MNTITHISHYTWIYEQLTQSERYKKNIQYGEPRRGHAEGTVEAHIKELDQNLDTMCKNFNIIEQFEYMRLKILIHIHDSFKMESKKNAAILDPESHASLAKKYLSELTYDEDLMEICQYHDLGYAVFRKLKEKGRYDEQRLKDGLDKIQDKNLFLKFAIIDACTPSKGREMITWFVKEVNRLYPGLTVNETHILPGEWNVNESW